MNTLKEYDEWIINYLYDPNKVIKPRLIKCDKLEVQPRTEHVDIFYPFVHVKITLDDLYENYNKAKR